MNPGKDFIGVGCGAIILNEKGEVLLLKRAQDSRADAGMWARPGGQVEFGESAKDAVVREVMEEVGMVVEVIRTLEFTESITEGCSKHWIALGFLVRHVSGEPVNMEPDKHDEIRWFSLDRLPDNLAEHTRRSIDTYLETKRGV